MPLGVRAAHSPLGNGSAGMRPSTTTSRPTPRRASVCLSPRECAGLHGTIRGLPGSPRQPSRRGPPKSPAEVLVRHAAVQCNTRSSAFVSRVTSPHSTGHHRFTADSDLRLCLLSPQKLVAKTDGAHRTFPESLDEIPLLDVRVPHLARPSRIVSDTRGCNVFDTVTFGGPAGLPSVKVGKFIAGTSTTVRAKVSSGRTRFHRTSCALVRDPDISMPLPGEFKTRGVNDDN